MFRKTPINNQPVSEETVKNAGALMESEVDADIKTLVLPASTTISAFGASLVDDADAAAARGTLELDTNDNVTFGSVSAGKVGVGVSPTKEIDIEKDTAAGGGIDPIVIRLKTTRNDSWGAGDEFALLDFASDDQSGSWTGGETRVRIAPYFSDTVGDKTGLKIYTSGTDASLDMAITVDPDGDAYFIGDVSALTFTDRTPFFEGDALTAILKITGKGGEIDHGSLPAFTRKQGVMKTVERIGVEQAEAMEDVEIDEPALDGTGKKIKLSDKPDGFELTESGEVRQRTRPVFKAKKVPKKRLKAGYELDKKTGKFYREVVTESIEERRDIGGMISMLTVAIQQQATQIAELKSKIKVGL